MSELIPINEIFGPTIQGEGIMIGSPTVFVRTQGCDMNCSWCDTKYALPRISPDMSKMTVEEVVDAVDDIRQGVEWVTLSGGNPVLHDLGLLVRGFHEADMSVALETQGTIYRTWVEECDLITVSPKAPSSGSTFTESMSHNLDRFMSLDFAALKIVVANDEDLDFVRSLKRKYEYAPMCVQPCNEVGVDTIETLLDKLKWLTEKVVNDEELGNVVILPQLHVLMYGNQRGK